MNTSLTSLDNIFESYSNTESVNDYIFKEFTSRTNTIPYLKEHRDYIEKNKLGFGERAFQYMWLLILKYLSDRNRNQTINALEIGVFKGQVISIWTLIALKEKIKLKVDGISPLKGNPPAKNKILNKLYTLFSSKYRKDIAAGNHYDNMDYYQIIKMVFDKFNLEVKTVNLLKGFSNDVGILDQIKNERYDLIYIDGDHSYEGVLTDLKNFCPKLNKGGLLVMDDASCNIPGTAFWKGHQSVSDACKVISEKEFRNVLNVGHNRVYQKIL